MMRTIEHLSEPVKSGVDFFFLGVLIAVLTKWLPALTAVLTLVWVCLRIWEIVKVRGWWKRRDP